VLGVKRPGRGVNHPPPSSAEVKERVELYLSPSSYNLYISKFLCLLQNAFSSTAFKRNCRRSNEDHPGFFCSVGVDGRIILKWTLKRLGVGTQTGLIWLRIGTGGGLLCIRSFHKMRGIS
jgi:hypothetical protein